MENLIPENNLPKMHKQPNYLNDIIKPWNQNEADAGLLSITDSADTSPVIEALYKERWSGYNFERRIDLSILELVDCGILTTAPQAQNNTHPKIVDIVSDLRQRSATPIVVSPAPKYVYGVFDGCLSSCESSCGILNVSPYLRIRKSGKDADTDDSLYAQIVADFSPERFQAAHIWWLGLHGNLNTKADVEQLVAQGNRLIPLAIVGHHGAHNAIQVALDGLGGHVESVMAVIDLGVMAACHLADCGGIPAEGVTPDQMREMAFRIGRDHRVGAIVLTGFAENLAPEGQSAPLIAGIIVALLTGIAARKLQQEHK